VLVSPVLKADLQSWQEAGLAMVLKMPGQRQQPLQRNYLDSVLDFAVVVADAAVPRSFFDEHDVLPEFQQLVIVPGGIAAFPQSTVDAGILVLPFLGPL